MKDFKKQPATFSNFYPKTNEDHNLKDLSNYQSPPSVKSSNPAGSLLKTFFGGLLRKKGESQPKEVLLENTQSNSALLKPKKKPQVGKEKFINRRNTTYGRINLSNLKDIDIVDESYELGIRDNQLESLDMVPTRATSYIENRNTGRFSSISNRAVKALMEAKDKEKIAAIRGDHQEDDLIAFNNDLNEFLNKIFIFCQGILPGLCLMHLLFIFLGNESESEWEQYSNAGIRFLQLFHIVSFISIFGSCFQIAYSRTLLKQSFQLQDENLQNDWKSFYRNCFSASFFIASYIIILYNHRFMSNISNSKYIPPTDGSDLNVAQTNYNNLYKDDFNSWKVTNVIQAIFAFLGWITILVNQKPDRPAYNIELEEDIENDDENTPSEII